MKFDLGLLCAVYGNFNSEKYLTQLIKSLDISLLSYDHDKHKNVCLYIITDTESNYNELHNLVCKEDYISNDYHNFSIELVLARPSQAMSIGYMRSSLLKYILGSDIICKYYYFVDADDYVSSQFFSRIFDQLDNIEYHDGDFYMINGLNVTRNQDTIYGSYTSRVFGGYPIYGDYLNPIDLLANGQATYALWSYIFTPLCFIHYLDLYGCYEDAVFLIRCMEHNPCKYILNVGYVHREESDSSLMVTIKKMKEMDKRNMRYQIGHLYDYYTKNPNPATLNLILGLYKYYKDRL